MSMTAPSSPAGDVAKLVEELRALPVIPGSWVANSVARAAAALESLSRDLADARAALEPIAEALDGCDDDKAGDGAHIWEAPVAMNLTYGDLRRARPVLSTQPKETPDG